MRRHNLLVVVFIALAVLAAITVLAGCQTAGGSGLKISDAWARSAPTGQNSAVYFVITNDQSEADTLRGVTCEAAMICELHASKVDASGKMTMEHQESVPVPAGEPVTFAPGGLHVMLMNLTSDLKPEQKIILTLDFEKAGKVTVEATVREP